MDGRSDRRQGPRREVERNLHYAEQALLAAGLTASDVLDVGSVRRLVDAAKVYRAALVLWEACIHDRPKDNE